MKNYIKGMATGIIIAVLLSAVPVFAQAIDVILNNVRINLDGVNIAQWGENYTLDNGSSVPYSILYKGTTYLPLRKIGELNNKQVHWNGDTRTATMTEKFAYPNKSNINQFMLTLAERADLNGNIWVYSAIKDSVGQSYIHINDPKRDFSRVYQYQSGRLDLDKSDAYTSIYFEEPLVLDDGIIFVTKLDELGNQLRKIYFASNADSQDGIVFSKGTSYVLFDDLMIAYGQDSTGIDIVEAINIKTEKKAEIKTVGRNPLAFPREIISYQDGFLTFTNSLNPEDAGDLNKYRVEIRNADTPIVGKIEDLGKI